MMPTRLLLLLFLTHDVFAKEQPDIDCFIMYEKYVHCSWGEKRTPEVNYTFYSGFGDVGRIIECSTYLTRNDTNTGCDQRFQEMDRFSAFYTKLVHGNKSFLSEHKLKNKVKLNPPTKLTVKIGPDSNLWFYWNQTRSSCVESEVLYRTNNKEWEISQVSMGSQSYCINLPVQNVMYELKVRSKFARSCGESSIWSDWCEPAVWGSNNGTDTNQMNASMSVWTPVIYVLGTLTLLLLVMMLLYHERVRVIIMPVVPKPSLISHDIQDWLQLSKGLKENFNPNYNERACPVREYCHVSQSDSESYESSISSVTTDQTDCSAIIPADASDQATPCSSPTAVVLVSSEE